MTGWRWTVWTSAYKAMLLCCSHSTRFCVGDTKLTERSSASDSETACRQCCCCGSSRAVYCSRCRLCVLVGTAVFVALLMCGVGFVAGWFASQLQHHPALAAEGNATGRCYLPRLRIAAVRRVVYLRFVLRIQRKRWLPMADTRPVASLTSA